MGWVTVIADVQQVEYRLRESAGCGLREQDPQVDADHLHSPTRLRWVGQGLSEVGITAGAVMTNADLDKARHLMDGRHPDGTTVLVAPKMILDPRGKLPAVPLLQAIRNTPGATDRIAESNWAADRLHRADRGVTEHGETHRISLRDATKLAARAGVALADIYDQEMLDAVAEHAGHHIRAGIRGFDVTLDTQKSVGGLLAIAPPDLADQLIAIHTEAVIEAVGAIEDWAGYTLAGRNGGGYSAERVETSGLLGWIMPHQVARPSDGAVPDPHLHTHVVLAHLARGTDGEWRTIAAGGRDLHRHAAAIDTFAKARFRQLTAERLGLRWHRDPVTGAWEITGVPAGVRAEFSKRSGKVTETLRAEGHHSATTGQAKSAAAASREAPTSGLSIDDLRADWSTQLYDAGFDAAAIVATVLGPGNPDPTTVRTGPPMPDLDQLAAIVFDRDTGLTGHRKTFRRADALAAVAEAVPGLTSLEHLEQLTTDVLAHRRAVPLPTADTHLSNAERYTTADLVAAEQTVIAYTTAGFNADVAAVSPQVADMAIDVFEATSAITLSDEQRDLTHRLLTAGHGVDAAIGAAGSGKTTSLTAARIGWDAAGIRVAGACTAAIAAAHLRADTGIASSTVASWLYRCRNGRGLADVDVLIIDEGAMMDDRDLAELLTHAAAARCKVALVGDTEQLRAPGAGGSFAAIHRLVGGLSLTDNRRQHDEAERSALAIWRDGNRAAALRAFAEAGRIHAVDQPAQAHTSMLTTWNDARSAYPDPHQLIRELLMVAATNETVARLNTGARAIRIAAGELTGQTDYRLANGENLELAVGDLVLLRRNDYRHRPARGAQPGESTGPDLLNGDRGVILAIDAHRNVLIEWVRRDQQTEQTVQAWVSPQYIAAGGLTHAYAVTIAKAQGITSSRTLIYGAEADAFNLYTALSRGRDRADLYLPRTALEPVDAQTELGDPWTKDENLQRALTTLADQIQRDQPDSMVLSELGVDIEPLPTPAARPRTPTAHPSPAVPAATREQTRTQDSPTI